MSVFISESKKVLDFVNLNPGSSFQHVLVLVLATLAATLALHLMAHVFHATPGQFGASLVIVAIGGLLTLALAASGLAYLPQHAGREPSTELMVVVFAAVSLLVTVPLTRLMWRTGYITALCAFVVAAGMGMAVVFATSAISGMFKAGKGEIERGVRHNQQTERLLND